MAPSLEDFHIPTINIAPYLRDPGTDDAKKVVRDVRNACISVGFFSLTGHGIPRILQDNVLKAAQRLFNLPLEEKKALQHAILKNRGYEIIGAQALQSDTLPDLKEVCSSNAQRPLTIGTESPTGLLCGKTSSCRLGQGEETPTSIR